jgi:hypothetical protein
MKTCSLCGDTIYTDEEGLFCFRCKQTGGHIRLEIYDKPDPPKEGGTSFEDAFIGKLNYKSMRRNNIQRGGFS